MNDLVLQADFRRRRHRCKCLGGQFDKAVEWQEKAIELAPQEQNEGLRSRPKLYQERKPYRDEPKN